MLIQQFLEHSAARIPEKEALICGNQQLTYRQIEAQSNTLAAALIGLGIHRRDRVILFLDNSVASVIGLFAVLKAGAIFIIPSPNMKGDKLSYIIKDSGAKLLITQANKIRVVREALAVSLPLTHIVMCNRSSEKPTLKMDFSNFRYPVSSWDDLVFDDQAEKDLETKVFPRAIDMDLATIIYTASTSARPVGVMWAHYNVVSAVKSITQCLNNVEDDVILNALPLSFDYGLYQVFMTFYFGGTLVLEKSFMFPYKVIENIDALQVSAFPIVPTMAALLMEMENFNHFSFSSLRYISNATGSLSSDMIRSLKSRFPHTRLYAMYGLPECQRVSYLPHQEITTKTDSVGVPIPNVQIRILDSSRSPVPPNQIGELVVRGTNVMQGYWKSPIPTRQRFSRDPISNTRSWLHTRDLFRQDEEGYLYFVAHLEDTVIVKGEHVSLSEIEGVLCELDEIREAAAIAVPDRIDGSCVKAFIVTPERRNMNNQQLLRHCAERLEHVQLPKYIEFRDHLPKLNDGRIDKKRLDRRGSDRRSNLDRRRLSQRTLHGSINAFIERRMISDRRNGQDRRRLHVTN